MNSPYLEDHLMHMIKQDQSKVHNMDLLWRYYEKNRNFGKAAHVLARLADMHRFGHYNRNYLSYLQEKKKSEQVPILLLSSSDHTALRSH